ncbi:MAG: 4a-hydroxytetrahydrobiopterin dehydratase [Betaproteobacteria bacterium]|nr:4a-hydroxytetrahydrobiopterin dehydratase [Betaproteobacteria bacterium]
MAVSRADEESEYTPAGMLAFVNAVAWISHREDHHPSLVVGYNSARVEYWTHAIGGLSENDFICAAKVDALFDL